MRSLCLTLVLGALPLAAQTVSVLELAQLRLTRGAEFPAALQKALPAEELTKGTAVLFEGGDFLWAIDTTRTPILWVDDKPVARMDKIDGTNLWFRFDKLETGQVHSFHYMIDGQRFGGKTDVPAFGPDSYEQPGVPKGKLSDKFVHTSKIYEGMKSDYWVWAPAQYDPKTPAAVMIWQDGEVLVDRYKSRAQIVFENLTHRKKIPVIVHVLISPGLVGTRRMRSIEYDTVNDTYARFLLEEILPEVSKTYSLRTDGYSRAMVGDSSGGICSFNAAWFRPDEFSRVLSRIGSFTSIQWKPGVIDGGNVYPNKIRKEEKRNIRVWLQDGANDLENNHGSWPLQNIQMANSLKLKDYDFHLSWGHGTHNRNGGHAELGEEMVWLWRDYDPARTTQTFTMDPDEKAKPLFRIDIVNR